MDLQAASPAPMNVSTIVTDREGRMVELNHAAAKLLNISMQGLSRRPRTLEMFFCVSRLAIVVAQRRASPIVSDPIAATLRPRELRPRPVVVRVLEASDGYLEWTIEPIRSSERAG